LTGMNKIKQRFFTHSHKFSHKENLNSLIGITDMRGTHGHSEPPVASIAPSPKIKLYVALAAALEKLKPLVGIIKLVWSRAKEKDSTAVFRKTWLTFSLPAFSLAALLVVLTPFSSKPNLTNKYSIYSGMPLISSETDYQIYSKDARSQKINQVFRQYNCPLEGLGEVLYTRQIKITFPGG